MLCCVSMHPTPCMRYIKTQRRSIEQNPTSSSLTFSQPGHIAVHLHLPPGGHRRKEYRYPINYPELILTVSLRRAHGHRFLPTIGRRSAYLDILRVDFGGADDLTPAFVQLPHLLAQMRGEVLVGASGEIKQVRVQAVDRRLHFTNLVLKHLIATELILQRASIADERVAGVQARLHVANPCFHFINTSLPNGTRSSANRSHANESYLEVAQRFFHTAALGQPLAQKHLHVVQTIAVVAQFLLQASADVVRQARIEFTRCGIEMLDGLLLLQGLIEQILVELPLRVDGLQVNHADFVVQ